MKCARSGVIAGLVGLYVLSISGLGRAGTLVLSPQKIVAEPGKWTLLPPESAMIDADAVPLYRKAIEALPDKAGDDQIRKWVDMPIDQMPLDRVEQELSKYMDSLKAVAKATKCRQCNWPEWKPGEQTQNLNLQEYRRLAYVIRLWAKLEIASDGYEGAALALQTGFGMARHLGQAPTILEGMVGMAVGTLMCKEVEEWVQGDGVPNLYPALASLPRPFIGMEKMIQNEREAALSEWKDKLPVEQIESELKKSHDQARLVVKRFESQLAALQCVEAIRSYAASHGGQLPATLAEVTENPVPKDPISDAMFRYTRTGSTGVLESATPADGNEKRKVHYEIRVRGG